MPTRSSKKERREKCRESMAKHWRERKQAEDSNETPEVKKESVPSPPPPSKEPEPMRRPSRQAARNAAKKIHDTMCNYGSVDKTKIVPEAFVSRPDCVKSEIDLDIDLIMECQDELLSPVQAEALFQAQIHYNNVMKTLRQLEESNVKIICLPADKVASVYSEDEESNTSACNNTENIIFPTKNCLVAA